VVTHVLIVAGPAGAGKSTFLRHLSAGKLSLELKAELPIGSQYWHQYGVRKQTLDHLNGKELDGVVLHCDLTKWGEINRVGLRRRLYEFLNTSSDPITIVNIMCPMERLIRNVNNRAFGSSNPLIGKLMLLAWRARSWAESATVGLVNRFPLSIAANREPYAVKLEKQLSKIELYQRSKEGWLEEIYLQWDAMLKKIAVTGVDIKQIYIEPLQSIDGKHYIWRRLPTPGTLRGEELCPD
jgi:hypothetical protein